MPQRRGKYCRLVSWRYGVYILGMKVENPSKASGVKGVSKTAAKKGSGDGAFEALVSAVEETEAAVPVLRPAAVGALDVLLALAAADSGISKEATRKAKKRAADLLELLEQMRAGLLDGELPASAIRQLSQIIATHRDSAIDPRLAEILDAIDLWAQVELAKLGR